MYEGWSNYPTWCVKLWIDNNAGMADDANSMARCARSVYDLEDTLRDWIMESIATTPSLAGDLLDWALGQANWREIADAFWHPAD